ncbi:restriction endonuclease subunit S [Ruegeria atlantica]|uniref:restriction endonuclease subunit S n=1 Tax=Ruegeria atlantica TaxID=81569 RepID=UPI00147A0BEE|nr:restriction endonuclease subunit S [Ruegeria atlantica]
MNAERLLEVYEKISEAPDAIGRLRRFVLNLAVRGKLVEQDTGEEPASLQCGRIAAAKAQLALKERKARKKLVDPSLTEISFDLPDGWAEARFADLVRVVNGRAYKKPELLSEGTPVLRVGNLFTSDHWYYSDLELEEDKYCNEGDLIYAWSASFGPFIWEGPRVIYHYHIWKLPLFSEDNLSKRYIFLFLQQKTREIKDAGHGISMIHMTKEKMEQLAVPVPPLAEQHRIVARVDELMGICDRLEEARKTREKTRDKLAAASLTRLTAPETSAEEFPAHAQFALDALPSITSRPDQIKTLRQTILNLAVRGKLVEQNPEDEPASDLLIKIGALRRRNSSAKVKVPDLPFSLPDGWASASVQDTLLHDREISYGVIKLGNEPKSGGVPTLRCSDVRPGYVDERMVRRVQEDIEAQYHRTRLFGGEVLINIRGTLGGVAEVPVTMVGFNVAREVAVIPISELMVARYMVYLMLSPFFWDHIQGNLRGIAYKGLNLGTLRALPIPIPPQAEQRRIVSKLDVLMAICDRLEATLTTADTTRTRLLDALLKEALEPATGALEAAE